MRSASRSRALPPAKASSRWWAARTMRSARICCCSTNSAASSSRTCISRSGHAGRTRDLLVLSGRTGRDAGAVTEALRRMWEPVERRLQAGRYAVLSGATGVEPPTAEEQSFLAEHPEAAVRATGSRIGHGMEGQFPMNIALAALAVRHGILFPPCNESPVEPAMEGPLAQAGRTGGGHWRGEGMALGEAAH